MNFRKASIFQRDTEKPEEQNDSGGMLAVWGSPGSGKTITAVKIAKMLSARKKNVILLLCDMAAPMLPCICPADALESNGSLAGVLAAARISENLIKHNLVTFKRNSCLAVLGLLERQNEYSTPPFTQKQVVELLDGLRQIDRGRAAAGAGRGGARGLCECGGEQGAHLRRVQGGGRSGHSRHGPQGRQQCGRGHLQRAALHGRGRTGPRPAGLAGLTAGPECGMICPPGRRCMRCLSGRGRGYFEWMG